MRIFANIIIVLTALSTWMQVSAQDSCINEVYITDSLYIAVRGCAIANPPSTLLKYRHDYCKAIVALSLVIQDSIYHDSTEVKLKKVKVAWVGLMEPRDSLTWRYRWIVMRESISTPSTDSLLPPGWNNKKRNRFIRKISKELCPIFNKCVITVCFEKPQKTPLYVDKVNTHLFLRRLTEAPQMHSRRARRYK